MGSSSDYDTSYNCRRIISELEINNTLHGNNVQLLYVLCKIIHYYEDDEVKGKSYSRPMLWIGIYIAAASLFCIIPMAADLFHGFQNRKLWFPCKYFTLNAASITMIAIAMKLPVDLSSRMPGSIDQFAKVGSMTFMCTLMANLMPSLASMDHKELFANVVGMVILVVTMVVNILIQIETGLVQDYNIVEYITVNVIMYINIGAMLSLLLLVISSALTIPTSKRILELKYQAVHKTTSNDLQHTRILSTVEELTQRVRKYWMMAGTCSPQFVMITTPLSSAAGVICVFTAMLHYFNIVVHFVPYDRAQILKDYYSDYKWSMVVILITQSIGIAVGVIAPIFRCFTALSYKLSMQWIKKHTNVFHVEKYWTQMLFEWKKIRLVVPLSGHISKSFVYISYNVTLNLCVMCQKVIVVSSKVTSLVPLGMVIIGVFCVYCWKSAKTTLFAICFASNRESIHIVEQNDTNEDIGKYALQLQDKVEIGVKTLKNISNSVNLTILKAEKQLPINLLKLINKSTRFEGVVSFYSDNIPPLIDIKFPNSWSLSVVTLTCIAITLPNIRQESADSLFNSVCESLSYTLLIEESLNNTGKYVKVLKATTALWREVEVSYRWLGNTLQRNAHRGKNPKDIIEWFSNKAKEIVSKHNNDEMLDDKLIAADFMYRVTQTIKVNYLNNIIRHNREEQLFCLLSDMIVDIMVACFANLPRVITMKCHESAIEKREASVEFAAKLLGSSKKIIEKLQLCDIPKLDPNQMAFIDEWRFHLKQSNL